MLVWIALGLEVVFVLAWLEYETTTIDAYKDRSPERPGLVRDE